jgi:hypothetical protein
MVINLSLYLETKDMPTYVSRMAELLERYVADLRAEEARTLHYDPKVRRVSCEKAIFYPTGAIKVEVEHV